MTIVLNTRHGPDRPERPRHPEKAGRPDTPVLRKPEWIRVKAPASTAFAETRSAVRSIDALSKSLDVPQRHS